MQIAVKCGDYTENTAEQVQRSNRIRDLFQDFHCRIILIHATNTVLFMLGNSKFLFNALWKGIFVNYYVKSLVAYECI